MSLNPFEGLTRVQTTPQGLGVHLPAPASSHTPVEEFFNWFERLATPEEKTHTIYRLVTLLPAALTADDTPEHVTIAAQALKALKDGAAAHFDTLKATLWEVVGKESKKVEFASGVKFRFANLTPRTNRRVDWKKFQAEHPDLYAQYVTETISTPSTGALYL